MKTPQIPPNVQMWLAIGAVVISVSSLVVSYCGYRINEASYSLNLTPILKSRFLVDRDQGKYRLHLANNGPNDIYDIRIRIVPRLISSDFHSLGELGIRGNWNQVKRLAMNDTCAFDIQNDYIERSFQGENFVYADSVRPAGSALTFLISFSREPDRKRFRDIKTLFFFRESRTGKPIDFDPNDIDFKHWRDGAKAIESEDQDREF